LNESKDGEFPPVPFSLINKLNDIIPEKCPDLTMSERDIFFYAGQRAVVRMLQQIHEEQTEVT
jgi:hypothetical protein